MQTIYVYVLDTFADWELGYVTAELNTGRFFKKGARRIPLRYVSCSKEPVTSMGGLTVLPDCTVDEIALDETSVLLLPGANTWDESEHGAAIETAGRLLAAGGTVCAICGATAALARAGLLDDRPHTSNGPGFLELFAPGYRGQGLYVDSLSFADGNLITAGPAGALLWAKQIIARMEVFEPDVLEAWYAYFSTGDPQYFYQLMQKSS
ncbi:MAG: DJ-1/PfpI family protein [Butyricicoccus sp.]|nr:DJ-1/PfpI family protein [Butyricicoccus sp.]